MSHIIERLESDRLFLRRYRKEDSISLCRAADNKNISKWLRDLFPYPYSMEQAESFIESRLKLDREDVLKDEVFVICFKADENEVIGGLGIHAIGDIERYCSFIGYWLREDLWGKGIMGEAVGCLVKYAFSEEHAKRRGGLRVERLEACIFSENVGSGRVLEKNGFALECVQKNKYFKHGCFHDGKLYVKFRS